MGEGSVPGILPFCMKEVMATMPAKIWKRKDGTYMLTVAVGYDAQGKQVLKRKTIQASSQREAERAYVVFAAEVQKGEVAFTGKMKLSEFAQRWFDEHCRKELAPKTQESYRNHLNHRILPGVGHLDISKIRPAHVIQFLGELREKGTRFDGRECRGKVSEESVRYCFRVLSSMLKSAVQWQIIPSNPCDRVKPPAPARTKVRIMDEASVARMIRALEDEPMQYRVIVMLAIDTGLRLGELMALKWSDIDMGSAILKVTKANQAVHGKGIITKSPKNESSIRSVTISSNSLLLLEAYRSQQQETKHMLGSLWADEEWLFTKWDGSAMYPTTPSQWFQKFLKRHSLPHMPFHGLRHLSATVWMAQGIPLKNVSSRLGHADIRTTANIYSEALQSIDRQAASTMDEFIQRSKDT